MKAVIQLHKLFKKDEDYKKRKQAFTQDQDSKVSNGEQDLTRQKETLIALEAHFRELEKGFLSKAYHEAVTATKCLTVKGLHTPTCILRYGCPRDSRREIWLAITGARDLKHQHGGPRYYTQCIQNATESNTKQIAKDLHRTSPLLAVFHDSMNTESLRRVLFAVATHLKHSYCQGMNVVAALLLLVYTPRHELDVFYTLISLVERNKYSAGYYDATLSGVQRDIRVLDYLIFQDDPLFSTHLQNILGIRPAGLFVDWAIVLIRWCCPNRVGSEDLGFVHTTWHSRNTYYFSLPCTTFFDNPCK